MGDPMRQLIDNLRGMAGQIDQLSGIVRALADRVETEGMTPSNRVAVDQLVSLLRPINRVLADRRPSPSPPAKEVIQ